VYRGSLHGLTIAVKSLRVRYATPNEKQKLVERLALMALLRHDHVARHFGHSWNTTSQQCLLFMEYYNQTLRHDLDRRNQLLYSKKKNGNVLFSTICFCSCCYF